MKDYKSMYYFLKGRTENSDNILDVTTKILAATSKALKNSTEINSKSLASMTQHNSVTITNYQEINSKILSDITETVLELQKTNTKLITKLQEINLHSLAKLQELNLQSIAETSNAIESTSEALTELKEKTLITNIEYGDCEQYRPEENQNIDIILKETRNG